MSEIIFLVLLTVVISSLVVANHFLKKEGLSLCLIILAIISYILSFKNISLLGISINSNSITYATIFVLIYLYNEKYKEEETKKLIKQNTIISLITLLMLMLVTGYIPAVNDTISINMQNTFGNYPRLLLIYPLTLTLSEYLSLYYYRKLKETYNDNFITLAFTYLIIGLIDTIIFSFASYINILDLKEIVTLATSTYLIRLLIIIIYYFVLEPDLLKKKVKK